MVSYPSLSYHIISYHIIYIYIIYHISYIIYHISYIIYHISYIIYHISYIISYHISYIIYHIISYHIISYHIISYHLISCHIVSCHNISSYTRIVCRCTIPYHAPDYTGLIFMSDLHRLSGPARDMSSLPVETIVHLGDLLATQKPPKDPGLRVLPNAPSENPWALKVDPEIWSRKNAQTPWKNSGIKPRSPKSWATIP